jgi:hypothetical protein
LVVNLPFSDWTGQSVLSEHSVIQSKFFQFIYSDIFYCSLIVCFFSVPGKCQLLSTTKNVLGFATGDLSLKV